MIVGADAGNSGGNLVTDSATYGDFEIVFDVWPDYSIDSGVIFRADQNGNGYQVTIDYQPNNPMGGIYLQGIGNIGSWDFTIKDHDEIQGSPSHFPLNAWSYIWKENYWNQFRVRVEGNPPTITVWINGWKVNTYTDTQVRTSAQGTIALQLHPLPDDFPIEEGALVRFKNIKVYEYQSVGS